MLVYRVFIAASSRQREPVVALFTFFCSPFPLLCLIFFFFTDLSATLSLTSSLCTVINFVRQTLCNSLYTIEARTLSLATTLLLFVVL